MAPKDNSLTNLMTEFPCKIPTNFNDAAVCPKSCMMYEPPWADEVRGGAGGYCAPFYDPSNSVDCTGCGTMRLYSGPIDNNVINPDAEPPTPPKMNWQDRIKSYIDKFSPSRSDEVIKFIKNISK